MDRTEILKAINPEKPEPGLYLVATPIGNASDLTLRALEVLATCDVIYCEDTRVTSKLLNLYGLKRPLEAYHDHNGAKVRPKIIARLAKGEVVALVSDAGTPLISDPGYRLVKDAQEQGHAVTALPGASAVLTGLSLSGLPTDRFSFLGFLPPKQGARRTALSEVSQVPTTLIFYEAASRLAACLGDMKEVLGDRHAAVARELTKKFEETRQGRLSELAEHYESAGPPKGEIVIVVEPPIQKELTDQDLQDQLAERLTTQSLRDAVKDVAAITGAPRKRVYDLALELSKRGNGA